MGRNNYEVSSGDDEPPRIDTYDYSYFSPEENPEGELLARQIQAQSYVAMGIVRPEGLITLENGVQILAPDAANPPGYPSAHSNTYIEYALGIERHSTDMDPMTGHLVAWKKLYAPLDSLPTYQLCRSALTAAGEEYLRKIDTSLDYTLVETEALGKTIRAGSGVVKEFIRAEIQRSLGRKEVWLMGLVGKTAYKSFVHNWGKEAIRKIGEPCRLDHAYVVDDVELVPTVLDIDAFFSNMAYDILSSDSRDSQRRLANFVYMAEGVGNDVLGLELAEFRSRARRSISEGGTGSL